MSGQGAGLGGLALPLPGGGTARLRGGPFAACPAEGFALCLDGGAANRRRATLLLPIPDFGVPDDLPALRAALAATLAALRAGEAVYVGCRAGLGRTGLVLGCLARRSGVTEEPVAFIRRHYHPGAIETAAQEAFLREASLDG